ncbi:prepilin-type N-terminal cleavage/methylation domain-containing protein [Candidatus Babeliales bacterium]|nr:prepilin-type N-terminal cleavage/methylation domain-containing protein [Candidatus Babeliales bacterium]MBP9844163.1 prepilin-type N-terminal cleavage/methylation domain-containing protein [Candidatus Babeliales bacterium]
MNLKNIDKTIQPGFSALEIVMVMAVSAIMMTALFEIYNQVTRNMRRVERFVFEDTQILALKNRFGKDIDGLSSIWYPQKKQQGDAEKKSGEEDKQIKSKYFYSVNKDGHLDTLTFLTTNPLQSYGFMHDRFVRVVYQVENDPEYEGLFRLMRKEIRPAHENMDQKSLGQGKAYQLVGAIKSIEMLYYLIDRVEIQKQQQEREKLKAERQGKQSQDEKTVIRKEQKSIIRAVKQWDLADAAKEEKKVEKAQEEDTENLGGAATPRFIEMKIVFGKTESQVEKSYKLEFSVPTIVDFIPKNIAKVGIASSGTQPNSTT